MDKIKKFFDENKSLKILLPVLFVAVIILIVVMVNSAGKNKPANTQIPNSNNKTNNVQASTPPEDPGETDTSFFPGSDEYATIEKEDLSPFLGIPKYKGASRSSNNVIWGILEFSNGSIRVKVGDEVGGYIVKSISNDLERITLEKDNYESVLRISTSTVKE